jgi:hypothetical protein
MQVISKLIGLAGVLGIMTAMAACGSAGGTTNTGGGSPTGCTPGKTETCACVGGTMGVQTCKDDGRGFDECQCSTTTTSSGTGGASSSSSSGSMGTCGDGQIQPSDHCDNPSSEFYCKQDCMNATTSSSSSTSSSSGDPCTGHVYYAGKFDGAPSVWANLPGAGGLTKLDAGNAQCKALNIGADHVCDYEEVLKAQQNGELANIPKGTTAWVQRTTVAMVNGAPSDPGPGGRCNDWSYATNHLSDGEYISFDDVGVPTFHLDNDTQYTDKTADGHAGPGLDCGGVMRSILCCYTACN